jgi:hypothetical protein
MGVIATYLSFHIDTPGLYTELTSQQVIILSKSSHPGWWPKVAHVEASKYILNRDVSAQR